MRATGSLTIFVSLLVACLVLPRDHVHGAMYECGSIPSHDITDNDDVTGGYTMTVRHARVDPFLDLLPNLTYTVEISHNGPDRYIHGVQLEFTDDGIDSFNSSKRHDVICDGLRTPVQLEWTPLADLHNVIIRAWIWENETQGYNIVLNIHKPKGDIMTDATCGAGDAHSSGTPGLTFSFCEGCRSHYMVEDTGVLHSPGFPGNYPDNYNCTYVVYSPNHLPVRLQFRSFDFETAYGSDCFDSVTIQTMNTTKTICGTRNVTGLDHLNFRSDDGILYVTVVTDNKVVRGGFQAYYYTTPVDDYACTYTITNISGTISSPNYPKKYFPMTKCTVTINLPKHYRISLQILTLGLDKSIPKRNCSGSIDYLGIASDVGTDMVVFCGRTEDYSSDQLLISSSGSSMSVIFQSNSMEEGKGFLLSYNGIASCPNQTFENVKSGNFSSVNFPDNYLNNQECFLSINVSNIAGILELTFDHFHTTSYSKDVCLHAGGCEEDFVEIYMDGIWNRLCGYCTRSGSPLVYYTTSMYVLIRFVSDGQTTRSGYFGQWQLVDAVPVESSDCSAISVDFGNAWYDLQWQTKTWEEADLDCKNNGGLLASALDISAQRFLEGFLQNNSDCHMDKTASFWIGANDRMYERDFYWADGTRVEFTYWFKGWPDFGYAIHQPSDDGLSGEDCVEMRNSFPLPTKEQRITSSYYWNDRNCETKNPYICRRSKDGVTLPEGLNHSKTKVINVLVTDQPRIISSPFYPGNYKDFADITYYITNPNPFHRIHIHFETFNLEESERCEFDNITISSFNNSSPDVVRCGNWNAKIKFMDWISLSNQAVLQFRSDNTISRSGFKATIVAKEDPKCKRALQDKYSQIVEDADMMLLSDSHSCYMLMVGAVQSYSEAELACKTLDATLFHKTSSDQYRLLTKPIRRIYSDNSQEYISVWTNVSSSYRNDTRCGVWNVRLHGEEIPGEKTESFTHCHIPRPFVCVKAHNITDVIKTTTATLQAPTGHLKWPQTTGDLYENNLNMEYNIEASSGNRVFITIENVSIEYQQDCLYDYLNISGMIGNNTKICGDLNNVQSKYILSKGCEVKISFKTDSSIRDFGFELSWKWLSGDQVIQNDEVGRVNSINYPLPFPDSLNGCKTIFGDDLGSRVVITFNFINLRQTNSTEPTLVIDTGDTRTALHATTSRRYQTFISEENRIQLCLNVDSIEDNEGFLAVYTSSRDKTVKVTESIHITPNEENTGTIQSLHYPGSAPSLHEQTIRLSTDNGFMILLHLTNVSLGDIHPSRYAYLEIKDTSLGQGYHIPMANMTVESLSHTTSFVESHLNLMEVTFRTGHRSETPYLFQVGYTIIADPQYLEKTKSISNGTIGSCNNDTCLNGGLCVNRLMDRYACDCSANFTGLFCQSALCDIYTCVHGACDIGNGGAACACDVNYWGDHCNVTTTECNDDKCQGHGVCVEPRNDPPCLCDSPWTGVNCSSKGEEDSAGQGKSDTLLNEPIWIGMIVVLSLAFAFTSMFVVRRSCEKNLKCCSGQEKDKESSSGAIQSNYPYLGDMYKQYRYPFQRGGMSNDAEKAEEKHCIGIESPEITCANQRAAAKLFASYNQLSDLTVPTFKNDSGSLEKDISDTVGGLKGGTINFGANQEDDRQKYFNECEIADACFEAAVPILKISELGMKSFDYANYDTDERRSPHYDNTGRMSSSYGTVGTRSPNCDSDDRLRNSATVSSPHCYPEIVLVDSTPKQISVSSPLKRRCGSFYEVPTGRSSIEKSPHVPFNFLNVRSKRKRFASKLSYENASTLSADKQPTSSSQNFTSTYISNEHASIECNRLAPGIYYPQTAVRSSRASAEMCSKEMSDNGLDQENMHYKQQTPVTKGSFDDSVSSYEDVNADATDRKVHRPSRRIRHKKNGISIRQKVELSTRKNPKLPKVKSDSNLLNISHSGQKVTRLQKRRKDEMLRNVKQVLHEMPIRKSRSDDIITNRVKGGSSLIQEEFHLQSDRRGLYALSIPRRHSYHAQMGSEDMYNPDNMLNIEQKKSYGNDLTKVKTFLLSDKNVSTPCSSSDVSGMCTENKNQKHPTKLQVPCISDINLGFSSFCRSPYSDVGYSIFTTEEKIHMDSAYQSSQASGDVINNIMVDTKSSYRLENQIYTRLHNAALKLEKLSISEDSAVQFTVSEEDYDV